jgi:hypothetical protein
MSVYMHIYIYIYLYIQVGEGIMTGPENELQLTNTVHNAFQNAVLQKETAVLRQQCTSMQASCADLQRQLDRCYPSSNVHHYFCIVIPSIRLTFLIQSYVL